VQKRKKYTQTKNCSALSAKKKEIYTDEKFLYHSSSTFFEFSSSLLLEYGREPYTSVVDFQGLKGLA